MSTPLDGSFDYVFTYFVNFKRMFPPWYLSQVEDPINEEQIKCIDWKTNIGQQFY